jgi:hypothetical protein
MIRIKIKTESHPESESKAIFHSLLLHGLRQPASFELSPTKLHNHYFIWKFNILKNYNCTRSYQEASKSLLVTHQKTYMGTTTSAPSCINLSPSCLGFTSNYAVRRDYSSPSRIGSTSTTPCIATTRLAATPALSHLHLGRMVSPLGLLSGHTSSCTSSTLLWAARALRQHHSAPRLLASGLSDLTTCRLVALALLHLCCASERAVSVLDFSSVGRTALAVRPVTLSRRSTCSLIT